MCRVKPDNMEYITDEKSMYATIFIARYGKLIRCITLKLFIQMLKSLRFRCSLPINRM